MRKTPILAAALLVGMAGAAQASPKTIDTSGPIQVLGKSDTAMCVDRTESSDVGDAMYWCNRAIMRAESTIDERAVAYLHRGVLHLREGRMKAAQADIGKSIELTPHYGDAHFNQGNIDFAAGRYDQAVAAYSKALGLGITVPELAHYNRGQAYKRLGQAAQASADMEQAKLLADDKSALHHRLSSAR
ncbi:MAG TPA: tetratricopeptide repeat protein [Azospirillaceae bacterium]|nr:tetratricopeptide repeat protein [Azospirillaceae bacterium]